MYDCAVCLQPRKGRGTDIAENPVCGQCVKSGIMPKFDASLKHEFHYPPTWGHDFLQRWEEKKREYETPTKKRFYCCACEIFLCARPKDGSSFGVRCPECDAVTCMPCGSDLTAPIAPHVCSPLQSEDADMADKFKGLERGRHYQLCSRACGTAVELKDGCNHISCPGSNCSAEFCFICGAEATPDSGHWDVGKPCPRWNQPDDANAQHDIPDLEGRLLALYGDGENVVNEATAMRMDQDEEDPEESEDATEEDESMEDANDPEPLDLLLATIGVEAYTALVRDVQDRTDSLPRPPNHPNLSQADVLEFERANAAALLERNGLCLL